MNKIDKVVVRETKFIALWMVIFSAILQAVFLVIGRWNYTVLLGNILSGTVSVLNFLFMGITVQKMLGRDEKDAKQGMKASSMLRMIVIFGISAVGILLPYFSNWTVIIPLFFPRIIIMIRPLFEKKMQAAENTAASTDVANDTEVESADDEK